MTKEKETKFEQILTNSYKIELVSYMKSHPENFDEALALAISDKQPYSWRAAWLLWSCMDENDFRIQKYVGKIIDILPTTSDEQLRELLIILQRMELDESCEGKLLDICVNTWIKGGKKPSVRFNALKMIVRIVKKHPDLSNEMNSLFDSQYMEKLSTNVKKSISKMMAGITRC